MGKQLLGETSGMPQMGAAFGGWTNKITLRRIAQAVDNDGFVQETSTDFSFEGTIQPLSPKQIALKPEGQRAWQWLQIHCMRGGADTLEPNDKIIYSGKTFKVMGQNDYSLNNFIEYHLVEDYQA